MFNKLKLDRRHYLSLFCLIPGFGIIVGIILICYAIFKHKNTGLVVLYPVMMSLGIGLDKLLDIQEIKNFEKHRSVLVPVVLDELDVIKRVLNTYKMRVGKYPDSLVEIRRLYSAFQFKDIFSRSDSVNSGNYFYFKKEDGYDLFSVGVDGRPFTSDDIHLRRPITDTVK